MNGIWNMCVPSVKKRVREFSALCGKGSRGAIKTVHVRANTPQEAYTRLQRCGYTRISDITAI